MKRTTSLRISGALLAAAAFSLSSCKKPAETTTKTPSGGGASEPAADTSTTPAAAEAKTPEAGSTKAPVAAAVAPAAGTPLAEQILGYWAADKDAMIAMMKEEAKAAGEGEPDALAMTMIESMAGGITMHVKADEITMAMGALGSQSIAFKFLEGDSETGNFSFEVTPPGEADKKTEKGNIKGNALMMEADGQKLVLNRLTKEQFEAKKADGGGLQKALEGLQGAFEEGGAAGALEGKSPEDIAKELQQTLENAVKEAGN